LSFVRWKEGRGEKNDAFFQIPSTAGFLQNKKEKRGTKAEGKKEEKGRASRPL